MLNNRFSKIVFAIVIVTLALGTLSMVLSTTITSTVYVQSQEQVLREYELGERYGLLPEEKFSQAQIDREYWLGERYGVFPEKYTQEQADREYFLGERYGQFPESNENTP